MSKAKEMNLPNANAIVEVHKLRHRLGLSQSKVEESLVNSRKCKDFIEFNYLQFVEALKIPKNDAISQQLFYLYDKNGSGIIDFREYLLGVLALSEKRTTLEIVKIGCKVTVFFYITKQFCQSAFLDLR